jgi:hypothetical protein
MSLQHTFTWRNVEITVHTQTGMDELDLDIIVFKLGDPTDIAESYKVRTFARIVTQTDEIKGDLGFKLPSRADSADALRAAMDALLAAPGRLTREWQIALKQVDTPPGDPDLAPGVDEKKVKT